MATIGDVATAISLIGKVIKAATDAQILKKEFKELADYLELIGGQLEMLDDRQLGDVSVQTFQKMEEVLLQCHDLANSCQQRSSIYLIVKGKRIQNELRGAQEKITKYLTLIPLIHFTQVFRRFKEGDTKINENLHEHASDESDIASFQEGDTKINENLYQHASDESDEHAIDESDIVSFQEGDTTINENLYEHASDESNILGLPAERSVEYTSNGFQSNTYLFTNEQRIPRCTKLPSKQGSKEGSIIRGLILHCKRLFTRFEPVASQSYDNNFTVTPRLSFTYKQIVKMTFNFKTIIGRGGFGTIYLGHLEDGTDVAIKLRAHSSQQSDMDFFAELRSLTQVHHKNLISLIGYCKDESHLAIVYEYMPRGNLHDHLRGKAVIPVLTWVQRLQIAYQIALGLNYLHTGCSLSIVHRDVKSSNILLDENLKAKISDFGLSRICNENDTDETTLVVGTIGYLDPEYHHTGRISTACDVYSFGITLLEMITGQPPYAQEVQLNIVQWISLRVYGDVDFVDTSMNENYDPSFVRQDFVRWISQRDFCEEDFIDTRMNEHYDPSSLRKALWLALRCTNSSSRSRPRMAEVAILLKEIIEMKPFNDMEVAFATLSPRADEEVEEAFVTSITQADSPPPDMENEVEEAFVSSIAQADRPVCMHQLSANLFTSWIENTPGRRFWGCKNWKMADDCGYFKWHDPVQENVSIEQMDFVIHQSDELDEEIKMMDCKLKDLEEKIAKCKRSKEALEMKSEIMDRFYKCM